MGTTWVVETYKPWGKGQKRGRGKERKEEILLDEEARAVWGTKNMESEDEFIKIQ